MVRSYEVNLRYSYSFGNRKHVITAFQSLSGTAHQATSGRLVTRAAAQDDEAISRMEICGAQKIACRAQFAQGQFAEAPSAAERPMQAGLLYLHLKEQSSGVPRRERSCVKHAFIYCCRHSTCGLLCPALISACNTTSEGTFVRC